MSEEEQLSQTSRDKRKRGKRRNPRSSLTQLKHDIAAHHSASTNDQISPIKAGWEVFSKIGWRFLHAFVRLPDFFSGPASRRHPGCFIRDRSHCRVDTIQPRKREDRHNGRHQQKRHFAVVDRGTLPVRCRCKRCATLRTLRNGGESTSSMLPHHVFNGSVGWLLASHRAYPPGPRLQPLRHGETTQARCLLATSTHVPFPS